MLRCPECRTRRATFRAMQAHIAASGHKVCDCGAAPFKHRPGGCAGCSARLRSVLLGAQRAGEQDLMSVAAEWAWDNPGRRHRPGEPIPF